MPVLSRYDADANELRPQQALWRYDETSDDQSSGSNTCGGGSEILGSKNTDYCSTEDATLRLRVSAASGHFEEDLPKLLESAQAEPRRSVMEPTGWIRFIEKEVKPHELPYRARRPTPSSAISIIQLLSQCQRRDLTYNYLVREHLKEELLKKLIHRKLTGPTVEIMESMDPTKLPVRELPPGTTASLYVMYLAFCKVGHSGTSEPCGKSTFYNVFKAWSPALRFRKKSQHAMCVTCQTLKTAIHNATKDFDEHAKLCNQLLSHYSDQYKDRLVYWAARARSSTEGDILCMIVDSFDRSKLQLPAWPLRRTPKRTVYETINSDLDQLFAEKRKQTWG
ncbi:unnamed protein product [Cladocopium goreaui]|uniref:Uncharacterized protein n=1 Tax=Cladocopium goreaui TaxID=2562237 RepID=A0A9P1C6G5_9DINO|nr:unnamed protein product [Cladocopium goreaui]